MIGQGPRTLRLAFTDLNVNLTYNHPISGFKEAREKYVTTSGPNDQVLKTMLKIMKNTKGNIFPWEIIHLTNAFHL